MLLNGVVQLHGSVSVVCARMNTGCSIYSARNDEVFICGFLRVLHVGLRNPMGSRSFAPVFKRPLSHQVGHIRDILAPYSSVCMQAVGTSSAHAQTARARLRHRSLLRANRVELHEG